MLINKYKAAAILAAVTLTGGWAMALTLNVEGVRDGGQVPLKYTCQGSDVSPKVQWSGIPAGTKSLALICDDPDCPSGTWVHWVVYDIPTSKAVIDEGKGMGADIPGGGKHGITDAGSLGYHGPCPPPGKPHRYFFKLYALDRILGLEPGASADTVSEAMQGHVLDKSEVMGTFKR